MAVRTVLDRSIRAASDVVGIGGGDNFSSLPSTGSSRILSQTVRLILRNLGGFNGRRLVLFRKQALARVAYTRGPLLLVMIA